MASRPVTLLTAEQYLVLERAVPEKHEFIDGEMVAMSGGSPTHSRIAANLIRNLPLSKGGDCQIFNSDLRGSVYWSRLITYPDVTCRLRQARVHRREAGYSNKSDVAS